MPIHHADCRSIVERGAASRFADRSNGPFGSHATLPITRLGGEAGDRNECSAWISSAGLSSANSAARSRNGSSLSGIGGASVGRPIWKS